MNDKVVNVAKVIEAVSSKKSLLVGLVEIENVWIIKDLINSSFLRDGDYKYIHTDSMDEQGIDVTFLCRKAYFNLIFTETLPINLPIEDDKTRDILYVKGKFRGNDKWHIFINHWTSRDKRWQETEYKRLYAARQLRTKVEQLLQEDRNCKILIMGDFNDYLSDRSIYEILQACDKDDLNSDKLLNLAIEPKNQGRGSYNYREKWSMFDQMMINKDLYDKNSGYYINNNEMHIFQANWLLYHHKKYGKQPDKTYSKKEYHGSYSDHLPVYITLVQ